MDYLGMRNGDIDLFEMVSLLQAPQQAAPRVASRNDNFVEESHRALPAVDSYMQDQRTFVLEALIEQLAAEEIMRKQQEEIREMAERILIQKRLTNTLRLLEERETQRTRESQQISLMSMRHHNEIQPRAASMDNTPGKETLQEYLIKRYQNCRSLDDKLNLLTMIRKLRGLEDNTDPKISCERNPFLGANRAREPSFENSLLHAMVSPTASQKDARSPQSVCTKESEEPVVKMYGVRRREWGRWVSEIRCPGKERLWLGTYNTQREAGLAHDYASKLLRGKSARLNFPDWEGPVELPADVMDAIHRKKLQKAVTSVSESSETKSSGKRSAENSTEICSSLCEDREMFVESLEVVKQDGRKRQKRERDC